MNRMRKKIIVLLAVLFLVGIGYRSKQLYQDRQPRAVQVQQVGFKYPHDYQEQELRKPEGHAEQLINLKLDTPLSTIELSKETGAAKPANLVHMNFIDYLDRTSEQSLRYRYPKYSKISSERIKASGRDGILIKFTYVGQDEKTTLHVSFFILPRDNDAYYLFLQSVDEQRWQHDTETIQTSLELS